MTVFDPVAFGRDFVSQIKRPLHESAEAYERQFRTVLRFNPRDAEGRGPVKIVPRSSVVLTFFSGMGETPTIALRTRGATTTELSDGIYAAVERGAPVPHYYFVNGAEEPEVFVCASEEQSTLELVHWAHAFIAACDEQGVHAEIVGAEYVQATETFTRPSPGAVLHPSGTYIRVIRSRPDRTLP